MKLKRYLWVPLPLLLLNAAGAFYGGYGLMTDTLGTPQAWLSGTPFHTYHTPGAILFGIVGGTSLFAAVCLMLQTKHRWNFAFFAGVVLIGWILGELLLIRQFSWLQVIFLLLGSVIAWLSWPAAVAANRKQRR